MAYVLVQQVLISLAFLSICAQAFNIHATCMNEMELYVDGVFKVYTNNWKELSSVHLREKPQVLAIKCTVNFWGNSPIIHAYMSDNTITDRRWKCESFPFGPPAGWNSVSFDDTHWGPAQEITYGHYTDGRAVKWIMAASLNGNSVYCRKTYKARSPGCGRCGLKPRDVEPMCTRLEEYYVQEYTPPKCNGFLLWTQCTIGMYHNKRQIRHVTLPCCHGEMRNNFCHKMSIPKHSTCGISRYHNAAGRSTFIVGGTESRRHEFPWQVAVTDSQGRLICGGTIIATGYVVTAGHCVCDPSSIINGGGPCGLHTHGKRNDVMVFAGRHATERYDPSQQVRHIPVSNIIVHDRFDWDVTVHDIALLKLRIPLTFNENVTSACLPQPNTNNVGKRVIISGWGRLRDGSYPSGLRYTTVNIVHKSVCDGTYGARPNILCGTDGEGNWEKSSCHGDSGGPMVTKKNGRFTLIGVASFGSSLGCAAGHPFAYVDVSKYLTWIREKRSQY